MLTKKTLMLRGNKSVTFQSLALFSFIALSFSVSAANSIKSVDTQMITSAESALNNKQLNDYFSQLSPLDKAKAKSWGLSTTEWSKYKRLKETSSRAVLVPNIDPITLLGTEAKTDSERKYYARLFNDMEIKRSIQDVAFGFAQNADIQRRTPGHNAFKSSKEKRNLRKANYLAGIAKQKETPDEYVAFVDFNKKCGDACQVQLDQVTSGGNFVHFYFLNAKSDDQLFKFVEKHQIDAKKIKSGYYTLNYPDKTPKPFKESIYVELLSVFQEKNQ